MTNRKHMDDEMEGTTMTAYDQMRMLIAERLASSATERLAAEAHRTQVEDHRRLREIRTRVGGALAGAGSVLADQCVTDDGRASARRPA